MEFYKKNNRSDDSFFKAEDVEIIDSNIGNNCKFYKSSKIESSTIDLESIVGDFSRVRGSQLGKMVRIDRSNFILESQIGNYSYTGANDVIMHSSIGKFCSISWGVTIGPGNHDYSRITSHDFLYNDFYGIKNHEDDIPYNRFEEDCIIGNDVWVGTNSTILRGVKIGNGAVVGANSIVTKDVPPYAIVAGCPATIIKFRFEQSIINELQNIKWWNFSYEQIKKHYHLFNEREIELALKELKKI